MIGSYGIRRVLRLVGGLLLAGALAWVGSAWHGPGPMEIAPADRPLPGALVSSAAALRITVFGTSLSSARYDWPDRLEEALTACLGRDVDVTRVAEPGANIIWAAANVDVVRQTLPDVVILEFAINDADLRDGVGRFEARRLTAEVIADLRRAASEDAPEIVLMTMNPASRMRGVLRPRLAAHYADYRALAETLDLALADLEPRWRQRSHPERGLLDGLHPYPDRTREVILPVLLEMFGCPAGTR